MTSRRSKHPEERRKELLDAAERLFVEQGYEETSIRDIITTVGVAHGLFYYYFRSKEDILAAIIDRFYDSFLRAADEAHAKEGRTGLEMLGDIIAAGIAMKKGKERLFAYIGASDDIHIQEQLARGAAERMAPAIAAILRAGVRDGSFDTPYPDEAARAFLACGTTILDARPSAGGADGYLCKLEAYYDITARIIGARPGAVRELYASVQDDIDRIMRAYTAVCEEYDNNEHH